MGAQLHMDIGAVLPKNAYAYGERSDGETHGVVLTKRHVVELMLDLAGYTPDRNLQQLKLLEPACGQAAFLVPAIERLLASAKRRGADPDDLASAVVAYDVDPRQVALSRTAVEDTLCRGGISPSVARSLSTEWVTETDFLLAPQRARFDVVIGNPPYVRIEQLAPSLQTEYRRRYSTLYDRADLYVAFIERGLDLLAADGNLVFVCADRWIMNRYGAPLRALIARHHKVNCYIDLHRASPFESEVIAYPSIFSIGRGATERVFVGRLATASADECKTVSDLWRGIETRSAGVDTTYYDTWFTGDAPWVLGSPQHLAALRELERRFEPIEAGGRARVGIGVATGCDRVFIVDKDVDVEADRLVPLVMREDIDHGVIIDAGRRVINTFEPNGGLVALQAHPRLASYLDKHRTAVEGRHVAEKNPKGWYRTIDRVYPELVGTPKLLIPDIAGSNEVVFDEGRYYPHHNLYFVVSDHWDLEVLGGLLSSRVALFFVWSYAVKMRGGYLRFQAQYLRRIRVPRPDQVSKRLASEIRQAFRRRDFAAIDELAMKAYGITELPQFDFVDTRR